MSRVPTRPAPLLILLLALIALLATVGQGHAQADPETAVIADYAERQGVSTSAVDVQRLQAVTWNDACLGAAGPDEACAQVLTDGWVIWVAAEGGAARYHTNLDGSALRLAESDIGLDTIAEAPLPSGALDRVDQGAGVEPTPIPIAQPAVASVLEFLTALDAAGLPSALQEIAVLRPEIPVPSAGQVAVDGAAIQVFDLGSVAAGEDLTNALLGAGATPDANVTYWVSGPLAVVLTNAPSNPDTEQVLSGILGSPVLLTIGGGLPPVDAGPPPAGGDGADGGGTVTTGEVLPEVLPNTGSGGLARPGGLSTVLIATVAGLTAVPAVLALVLRRRRSLA